MRKEIIVGDFQTVFADNDMDIIVGNNCIVHAKSNCNITAGYNAKIFIKGNCIVLTGQYGLVIDTVGGSKFFSEKGTKFNVIGINTFNCVDSTICLQYRKTTSNVIIPNRECILRKEIPTKTVVVEKDEDEEVSQKLDKSYNILEYKDGAWTPSNNIYPFDWAAIERVRNGDRKRNKYNNSKEDNNKLDNLN